MSQRVETARRLRRDQTDVERKLWLRLRDRRLNGWKFKRQVPIDRYIADFCCPDGKLIIELDEASIRSAPKLMQSGRRFWNPAATSRCDSGTTM